ncbi:hypothetical protein [Pricia sp.]|uniref:hypothetical protein n=1 Tax=Pricia sp. TaxID=2268138 RepID=UPI0035948FAC
MKKILKVFMPVIILCAILLLVNCNNVSSENTIVGQYESVGDGANQRIMYYITHVKDNIYGIKVDASFDGTETQTDYLEGSFNPEERILTTKRSNVVLNYQFSPDYKSVELLGDENDIKLERK